MVSTNPEAEDLIKLNEKDADGQKDWKYLQLHYEGQGMFALEIKGMRHYLGPIIWMIEGPFILS